METMATAREIREWVVFENEGQKLFGILHRPPIEHPPLVLILHGFASSKLGTNRAWVHLGQALAESGIAALRFDFRGSGDSEGSLSDATIESMVSDALAACAFAQEEGFGRLGMFGSSLGGAISVLAAAKRGDIGSLALWAPVASGELWYRDFLTAHPALASQPPSEALATYKGVPLNPLFREQFGKLFAYKTLQELSDVPLLHFQGEDDETISLEHKRAFEAARQGAAAPSRFITYPETGHYVGYAKVFPKVAQELVSWFSKTL